MSVVYIIIREFSNDLREFVDGQNIKKNKRVKKLQQMFLLLTDDHE